MGIYLLAAFIGVPLLEIAVFIEIGGALGLWPTLALVILTAVLGTWQLRAQGLITLMRARDQVERGALPARELFDGACLLVAGALLLTPGFVTDAVGFLLFFPPVREILLGLLARRMARHMQTRVFIDGDEVSTGQPNSSVIDGDYRDVTERSRPDDPDVRPRPEKTESKPPRKPTE